MAFLGLLLNPQYALSPDTRSMILTELEKQKEIEKEIQAEVQTGAYDFASPFVIQDPYGAAPLTALVVFNTPENTEISIHVPGRTKYTSVDYTFSGFRKHHEIPVYGLYAGKTNAVTLVAKSENGSTANKVIDLQTESLPVYIGGMTIIQATPEKVSPGFNFSFLDHKNIFDLDGNIRWYATKNSSKVFLPLKNGHYLFAYDIQDRVNQVVMEQDLLGKIYSVYNFPAGIHHDIFEMPNGNFLATTEDPKATTNEDWMVEIDRSTGHTIQMVDFKDILDRNRVPASGLEKIDWLHMNSIFYDPNDHSILVSSRAQSAVIKFSYPKMQIQWILGPHDNWKPQYQPFLLEPMGETFEWQWEQHHATVYQVGATQNGIIDILLFDNGLYRSFNPEEQYSAAESYSRIVHYRVDEAHKTVEQVWQYGKERGSEIFSESQGSAYPLTNGDLLGTWSDINRDSQGRPAMTNSNNGSVQTRIIEVNPTTSEVVFEGSLMGQSNYRTLRASLYDHYAGNDTWISTGVNNTAESDLLDRFTLFQVDERRIQTGVLGSLKQTIKKILPGK